MGHVYKLVVLKYVNNAYILIPLVCTHAPFFKLDLIPPDFNGYIALFYISSD